MKSKIKRSIFGLSRKSVNRVMQEKEQEYAEDLKEKLNRINELKKDVRSMNDQIEKYKKNEAYMADTLVGVMERAEAAELREAEAVARIGLIKQQLIQINNSYTEHMQAIQQAQADLTALIANAEIAPVEGSQLLMSGLDIGAEADTVHTDVPTDSEEEYRFNELRSVTIPETEEPEDETAEEIIEAAEDAESIADEYNAEEILTDADIADGENDADIVDEPVAEAVDETEDGSTDEPEEEKNEVPDESGFDMKEALTGKERLDEICRELGLI